MPSVCKACGQQVSEEEFVSAENESCSDEGYCLDCTCCCQCGNQCVMDNDTLLCKACLEDWMDEDDIDEELEAERLFDEEKLLREDEA